jgi:hypothetical protein
MLLRFSNFSISETRENIRGLCKNAFKTIEK